MIQLKFNTPILPYSNTPFCYASEIFLSNFKRGFLHSGLRQKKGISHAEKHCALD